MSVTITLPDELADTLQEKAEAQHIPLDELVTSLLTTALAAEPEDDLALEALVARIKATPPNPASIRPATGSLVEALKNAPDDPEFDLETWNKVWVAVEAEMNAINRADDIAEGRK
jgi:hypothetical protein